MKKQFSLVFFTLLAVCFLGALPFYFSGSIPNFTDAVFESVSGFTTTGATVLRNIEAMPTVILFWRSLTQWLGGIGILLVSAGSFRAQKKDIIRILLSIYAVLTALQFILLSAFGMNWFDALTHSMSTISTGGFSIRNSGIAYYNNAAVEWVCVFFMFLSGINLLLVWLFFSGRAHSVIRNTETKVYAVITLISAAIVATAILPQTASLTKATRQAFFHVTSTISTCGFFNEDYSFWHPAAQGVIFFLLLTGGCSGSSAGGIKVIRHVILSKQMRNESKRFIYPRGIFDIPLDGKKSGNKKAVHSAAGFIFLYFLILFFTAILISSSGMEVFDSFKTALVCLGNTGLGLPSADFPAYVKWWLCLVMIAGRLELWTVAALLTGIFRRR
ncbi:MAG: TrkH family potassium uptake protein [Treponema sp.]|jgi:trk system potassium uptake protein TrkH|nr:TrkH family potassium uptake protein [Treponema sp.]